MSSVMLLCSLFGLFLVANASPLTFPVDAARRFRTTSLGSRTTAPYFPDTPASCPKCAAVSTHSPIVLVHSVSPIIIFFPERATHVSSGLWEHPELCGSLPGSCQLHHGLWPLRRYTFNSTQGAQIIFNPGAFVDVIQCSCTETFQAVFPQCVDWCVFTRFPLCNISDAMPQLPSNQSDGRSEHE